MADDVTYRVFDATDDYQEAVRICGEHWPHKRLGIMRTWAWNITHPDIQSRTACLFTIFEQVRRG